MIHPIIDEYYNHNPYHCRSSKFAVEKGLVTNEKSATPRGVSPMPTPGLVHEDLKKGLAPPKMHDSIFRSLTPEMRVPVTSHLARTLSSDSSTMKAENSTAPLDIRRIKTVPAGRPQEQGNTKKKRRSRPEIEPLVQPEPEPEPPERPATPQRHEGRVSYGDPAKIARFFPELG